MVQRLQIAALYRSSRIALGLISLLGALPAATAAERSAAAAREQLADLHLARAQARQLLPLVEQAATLQAQTFRDEAARLTEMADAFTAFLAEDRLNQGFTPAVERRAGRLSHQASVAEDALHERLRELEADAAKFLTKAQRAMLEPAAQPASRQLSGHVARTAGPRDWREMQQSDLAADRLRELRGELQDLHSRKSPRVGPLGRCLFNPAAYALLAQTAGVKLSEPLRQAAEIQERGTLEYPRSEVERQRGEIARLRAEINNWNLINGLHLTQDQIARITQLYDAGIPGNSAGRAFRRAGDAGRMELELAVEEVLNLGQRQVIADYKACLVPPKNLKDPVRVGQASDHTQYERWLTKSRQLNGAALDKAVTVALDQEAVHLGTPPPEERKQRETTLRNVARTAAKMSPAEFELSKADLAAQAAPPDRIREITHEMDTVARADGQPGRITRFMLNPNFMTQLRERGKQLADGVVTAPADLAAGPQAENCAKGCALRPKQDAR